MALPCGSRTPFFNVTNTRAFMRPPLHSFPSPERGGPGRGHATDPHPARSAPASPFQGKEKLLHQHRALGFALARFGHDAKPPRHFAVGFHNPAEIAAKAILVHLLVGARVPQPDRKSTRLNSSHV